MNKKGFPVVPVIAVLLKIIAPILLVLILVSAAQFYQEVIRSWAGGQSATPFMPPAEPITGFLPRLKTLIEPTIRVMGSLLLPFLVWGAAEMLLMLRQIAYNTGLNVPALLAKDQEAPPATAQKVIPEEAPQEESHESPKE